MPDFNHTVRAYLMRAGGVLNRCSGVAPRHAVRKRRFAEWDQILFSWINKGGKKSLQRIVLLLSRGQIQHLQSLPCWHTFKVAFTEVCGRMCLCVPVLATLRQPTWLLSFGPPLAHLSQLPVRFWPAVLAGGRPHKSQLSVCGPASESEHLRVTTCCRFTLNPATCSFQHIVSFSPYLNSPRCLLVPDDLPISLPATYS